MSWTEEGHLFAWHMKLRAKEGDLVYHVKDPASSETWTVDPSTNLTSWQLRKMRTDPDMILQYAHSLADQKRKEGHARVEVRAEARVSLNGREPQLLIDPEVDLAGCRRSPWSKAWILPLTEPLHPRDP